MVENTVTSVFILPAECPADCFGDAIGDAVGMADTFPLDKFDLLFLNRSLVQRYNINSTFHMKPRFFGVNFSKYSENDLFPTITFPVDI